jgi:hypothetical protein
MFEKASVPFADELVFIQDQRSDALSPPRFLLHIASDTPATTISDAAIIQGVTSPVLSVGIMVPPTGSHLLSQTS